jgi:DNA (cytosine-5)-methyltransferase 1
VTVGSLFAGIGGFDLAAERVWGPDCVRWQIEIETFAQRVLETHWPDVPRFGDITEVTGDELEPVDIACGGFPCQDISELGSKTGIRGARSDLWFHYARLIGKLRPRFVVVENVTSLALRGLDEVLGSFSELGYDAEWDRIPASSVGALHVRDRLWLVAYPQGERWSTHPDYAILRPQAVIEAHTRFAQSGSGATVRGGGVPPKPCVCGLADEVSRKLDPRFHGFGNAIVPDVAEMIFRWIDEAERIHA